MFHDRIKNDNNKGFDLSWAGPNATNIPKEAILVESLNQNIQLSNQSQWANTDDLRYHGRNNWYSNSHGASLKYTFDGVAIWYYASVDAPDGFYTVSMDGSNPERLSGANPTGQLTQQMLWSKIGLTPGRHTLTLTQDDDNGKYINLDYFRCVVSKFSTMNEAKFHYSLLSIRVLRSEDASALPSSAFTASTESTTFSNNTPVSTAPTSAPLSSPSNSSTIYLAVGLTIGLLFLGAMILFAFLYKRRSGRKRRSVELELDARLPTQHAIVPWTTWPDVGKQPSAKSNQQMRNQPVASELSVSVPDTPSSPGPRSVGLPPSYESHFQSGGVHLPQ